MKVLITGAAGFIGYHTAKHLSENGYYVVGIDNLSPPHADFKKERLERLAGIEVFNADIRDKISLRQVFEIHSDFSVIIHLAAQAGLESSIKDPTGHLQTNVIGFQNVLDLIKEYNPKAHLIYASSSSIYGDNSHPISIYGVSKITNEMMAHVYGEAYGIPNTGLRFYTVYGPWGRPDMSIYKFVDAIMEERPVELFNMGENERDFTYIDDVVDSIELSILRDIEATPTAMYDIGTTKTISMAKCVSIIEKLLGRKSKKWLDVAKTGDIIRNCATISRAEDELGYKPKVDFNEGLKRFIQWYLWYKNERLLEEDSK